MVPRAEFRSYYGQQILKTPTWKNPDVPIYLFLGGLAGTSAVLAPLAELTGRPQLARAGYLAAAGGAAGGTVALIHDLGRPARFLNMLRVVKLTSPLSIGSWILASFATMAGAAGAATVTGWLPGPARLAKAGAALFGPILTSYTAVLFADTAVPAWHDAHRELPFLFTGSALAAGAGCGLVAAPTTETGPARAMAVAGVTLERIAERRMNSRLGMLAEPYHTRRPGRWMRAGRWLTAGGAVAALSLRGSRVGSAVAGAALMAGSLCTRFGVFEAGLASAKDPKYTVVPQRKRLSVKAGPGEPGIGKTGPAVSGPRP